MRGTGRASDVNAITLSAILMFLIAAWVANWLAGKYGPLAK